ncbi:transcription initiation factor TFIID subunit 4-like [Salminus brasiliensis]|uniref:transcription initiation factor TFIID subunit 4-like n=1 Tax=Salminus brasiliensis TaxID=930266 RepID=UPI003B837BF4
MAAGSELLDDVFFNAEVDEKAVSAVVGSLESQLIGTGAGKLAGRLQNPGGHLGGLAGGNSGEIRDNNNMGLGQETERAGVRVPAGARVPSTGAGTPGRLKQGLEAASTQNHTPVSGQRGTSLSATLNGSNAVMVNSHDSPAFSSTSSSSALPSSSSTVVNNGPGCVLKGPSAPSGTVIQTSLMNASTVISTQASCLTAGPTIALVRPPMQTQVVVTAPNGTNSLALSAGVNAVHLPTTLTVAQGHKADSPKTLQTVAQAPTSVVQPVRGPVMQTGGRTMVQSALGAGTGAIRAIAPQVLAPRVPQPQQSQPSVHNIQLPPGMVLVRSESGQLLMIHQQTLAQMQAQSQGTMAQRPATPTSTPPVHITSVQAPGTPLITRQVAPTTIMKQGSPVPAGVQPTTALQRPPLMQNAIMLGGTQAPPVGTPPPGQVGVAAVQRVTTAGSTPAAASAAAATTASTETLENVKKCKNFLSTLIKLASSGKQSSETAANVKELVKNLLEGKLEAEDFTSRLYRELNSSPQPYLVPFLKRSLPALRQMTPDSAAFIQQSQLPQPTAPPSSTALTSAVLGGSTTTQRPAAPPTATPTLAAKTTSATLITSTTSTTSPHQPVISLPQHTQIKPNLIVQQPQQQGALVRAPQVSVTQTPMVTLRPGQLRMFSPQTVVRTQTPTLPPGSMLKTAVTVGSKVLSVSGSLPSAIQKTKPKDAGSGNFRDDDDINDVASMAGVNLSEESDRILATNSELVGAVTRSCKDEAFLFTSSLQSRILEIGKKYGISELGADVISIVSHATQQRLQTLMEKVTQVAQQKNVSYKEDERHEQVSDVRAQLKFFEQLDQMEKQRKEEQEREILMKAAKSRSRQEDPEQLRLKQKAKEMQQQELAQMRQRDANLTALAAIGPRKKRKVDSAAGGSGPEGVSPVSAGSGAVGSGGSRQFSRQRITRVNLRDLLFCLENERETSHSHLLYKAFLK